MNLILAYILLFTISYVVSFSGYSKVSNTKNWEKMSICLFRQNFSAKCPISETIYGNVPVLKLNFLKIEFQLKTRFLDNRVVAN